jgi:hypothetical protein
MHIKTFVRNPEVVFLKLCSVDQQVGRRGPQVISEENRVQKKYKILDKRKLHPYISVLQLPLLVDLQQKVAN